MTSLPTLPAETAPRAQVAAQAADGRALHALGRDPAYGSGPLATVIQDLLSILVYFLLAGALL